MKIYTYYTELTSNKSYHKSQLELLDIWSQSWRNNGFTPIVLKESDLKKSSLYYEMCEKLPIFGEKLGEKTTDYGMSCYLRWLAYSQQDDQDFYVSDYDVINKNFKGLSFSKDNIHLLNNVCPCLAYGSSKKFFDLCKNFISVTEKNFEKISKIHSKSKHTCYHDQEFFDYNYSDLTKSYNISVTTLPHWGRSLFHVSHHAADEFIKSKGLTVENHDARVLISKSLIK